MAGLILGPLVRFVDQTEATVWVETDAACEVAILGATEPTFQVEGHHYALVHVSGLAPGTIHDYEVRLDGERVWPEPGPDAPAGTIRTINPGEQLQIAFGSCRQPPPPPSLRASWRDGHRFGRGPDALRGYGDRLRGMDRHRWPDLLLFLGDQVYADDTSPAIQEAIRHRRDPAIAPGYGIRDFEEYTLLYREAWEDPAIRWLLASVPTAMIFDDHDIHDDWNTSAAWVEAMRAKPWWHERIVGGLMAYWLYQHIGNLDPATLAADETYAKVIRAGRDGDAGPVLREFAARADREPASARWSYTRDIGRTRLVMIDSRCGRVLDGDRREMLDESEWAWLEDRIAGDVDHLLVGTSLPFLLLPAIHLVEAWDERLAGGAWGSAGARMGERLRQAIDLEHWAAFGASFDRLAAMVADVAAGARGPAPATVVFLSGDVHNAYLAEATFPVANGAPSVPRAPVYQAVCSPLRNELERSVRRANRVANTRLGTRIGKLLGATAGAALPSGIAWRVTEGPWYENQIATLVVEGRVASLRIERARAGAAPDGPPRLETVLDTPLASGPRDRGGEPVPDEFPQPAPP